MAFVSFLCLHVRLTSHACSVMRGLDVTMSCAVSAPSTLLLFKQVTSCKLAPVPFFAPYFCTSLFPNHEPTSSYLYARKQRLNCYLPIALTNFSPTWSCLVIFSYIIRGCLATASWLLPHCSITADQRRPLLKWSTVTPVVLNWLTVFLTVLGWATRILAIFLVELSACCKSMTLLRWDDCLPYLNSEGQIVER